MNNQRRKRIENLIKILEDLQPEIDSVAEEERDAFDNLPESLQQADRGSRMEEVADALEEVSSDIEDMIATLYESLE